MRNLFLTIVLGLSVAVATNVKADSIVLYQDAYSAPDGVGSVSGGEFSSLTTPVNFLNYYSPLAEVNAGAGLGFETFCVEVNVDFYPGSTYSWSLGSSSSDGTPLALGTAYLYYLFAKGALPQYSYSSPSARLVDAGLLQAALWFFQGGQTWSGDPFNPLTNPYYLQAINQFGLAAFAPNAGLYPVDILNLTDGTNPAQNQLVVVPDGGSTVLLLGAGFTTLSLIALRARKTKS